MAFRPGSPLPGTGSRAGVMPDQSRPDPLFILDKIHRSLITKYVIDLSYAKISCTYVLVSI